MRKAWSVTPAMGASTIGAVQPQRPDRQRHSQKSITVSSTTGQQATQQRQRQADDVAVVADDAVEERRRPAVEREAAGDLERLAGGEVGLELGVGVVTEVHLGRRHVGRLAPGGRVDDAVAGAEHRRAPPQPRAAGPGPRSIDAGLPWTSPSTSSSESQPIDHGARRPRAGSPRRSAFAAARATTSSGSEPAVTASSSTPETTTSGDEAGFGQQPEAGRRGRREHETAGRQVRRGR